MPVGVDGFTQVLTRTERMRFVLTTLMVACGSNASTMIPVTVPGQPVLMTLKLGTGGWKSVAGAYDVDARATTYQIDASDELELVGACVRANNTFIVSEVFGTADDAEITLGTWQVPDCEKGTNGIPPPPTDQRVTFSGVADSTATVAVDYMEHTSIAAQPFTFETWSGIHDLLLLSGDVVLLQHDVDLTSSKDLGALPIGTNGVPLLSAEVDVSSDADEITTVQTQLVSARGAFHYWGNEAPGAVVLVPPDLLAPGDVQSLTIALSGPGTLRVAKATVEGTAIPHIEFLPRLSPVTFESDRLGVVWTPLDSFYTSAVVEAQAQSSAQFVAASKLWLERHSPDRLELDTNVDGYDPAWQLASPSLLFFAERWNPDVVLYTEANQTAP